MSLNIIERKDYEDLQKNILNGKEQVNRASFKVDESKKRIIEIRQKKVLVPFFSFFLGKICNDKREVLEIQNQMNQTDKEIDNMVYNLYNLTEEKIKIVERI